MSVAERLTRSDEPSVVWKVVAAFLAPLVVFILALTALNALLANVIPSDDLRAAAVFLMALGAAVGSALVGRAMLKRAAQRRSGCSVQGEEPSRPQQD